MFRHAWLVGNTDSLHMIRLGGFLVLFWFECLFCLIARRPTYVSPRAAGWQHRLATYVSPWRFSSFVLVRMRFLFDSQTTDICLATLAWWFRGITDSLKTCLALAFVLSRLG